MNDTNQDRQGEELRASGRPYAAPRLYVYGALRELTEGGTGSRGENTNFPNKSKP